MGERTLNDVYKRVRQRVPVFVYGALMLNTLRKHALWIYGAGAALIGLALIVALFFWPGQNTQDALLLPVIFPARYPFVLIVLFFLSTGILLYGQHYRNGLRSLFLTTITVMGLMVILFVVGMRINTLNLFYYADRWIDGQNYVLTSHEPVTSRCDETTCYQLFSLYECDSLALNCTLHLRDMRGAGGYTKLEFYDDILYVYDSFTDEIIGEYEVK